MPRMSPSIAFWCSGGSTEHMHVNQLQYWYETGFVFAQTGALAGVGLGLLVWFQEKLVCPPMSANLFSQTE